MVSLHLLRDEFFNNSKAIAKLQGKTEKEVRNSITMKLEETHSPLDTDPLEWYRRLYNLSLNEINFDKKLLAILANLELPFAVLDYIDSQVLEDIKEAIQGYDSEKAVEILREVLIEKEAFQIEITYYSEAMDYLKENDNSLYESIELAVEMGHSLENITSTSLAELLATRKAEEDFNELEENLAFDFSELQDL